MPTTPFLNMFGRSPIQPLEEHMSKVYACVKHLDPFFEVVMAKDWREAEKAQQKIVLLEQKADDLKRDIRLHLPNNLFTSVSRSDLLELLNVQDRLANTAKDIAGMVYGRKIEFPEEIKKIYIELLLKCIEASKQADIAIHELDELLETGFSGSEIKLVQSMIAKLSHIERESDEQQVRLRQIMFNLEDSIAPVKIIFLYKIIEWTGDIADLSQEVGDRLQILLAR